MNKIYIEIQRNEFIRKNFTVKLGQPHGEHYDNFSIFNENSHYTIDGHFNSEANSIVGKELAEFIYNK